MQAHFGGLPVGPDVKKLDEAFSDLKPGAVIGHEDIEAAINEERASTRYRTVVKAWRRKLLKERNIDTDAIPGQGIKVLGEAERIEVAVRDHRRGGKQILKAGTRIALVDSQGLDDLQRKKLEQASRAIAASGQAVRTEQKALATFMRAPAQLPRRTG